MRYMVNAFSEDEHEEEFI